MAKKSANKSKEVVEVDVETFDSLVGCYRELMQIHKQFGGSIANFSKSEHITSLFKSNDPTIRKIYKEFIEEGTTETPAPFFYSPGYVSNKFTVPGNHFIRNLYKIEIRRRINDALVDVALKNDMDEDDVELDMTLEEIARGISTDRLNSIKEEIIGRLEDELSIPFSNEFGPESFFWDLTIAQLASELAHFRSSPKKSKQS